MAGENEETEREWAVCDMLRYICVQNGGCECMGGSECLYESMSEGGFVSVW